MAAGRATPTGFALSLIALGLLTAPLAHAETTCAFSGAPGNVLTVTETTEVGFGVVNRTGQEIQVGESSSLPSICSGGVPTVSNTDTVRIRLAPLDPGCPNLPVTCVADVHLRLSGGPFAPGATPEPDGTSEIEVELIGPPPSGVIVGTEGPDTFLWGAVGADVGVNLNPRVAGDTDLDVTAIGTGRGLFVDGGGGNDTIAPAAGSRVPGGVVASGGSGNDTLIADAQEGSFLYARKGRDLLSGGRSTDVLRGGGGRDRVRGLRGGDVIYGGNGPDLIVAGRGGDLIYSGDLSPDTVRCGPGFDRVLADRRDTLRGCERVLR